MQRILSVQTSRSAGGLASDFVTKKLCCSFVLVVAFFGLIAGFLLGRFTGNRDSKCMEVRNKLVTLDENLKTTFQMAKVDNSSSLENLSKCAYLLGVENETAAAGNATIQETLDKINACFSYG